MGPCRISARMFDSGGPTCMDGMRSKIPHCSCAGAPYVKTVIRVVIGCKASQVVDGQNPYTGYCFSPFE